MDVSADEFRSLFEKLRTWGRWGPDDERGALNLVTAERVAAATGLVRDGITTTLSLPLNTHLAEHNPNPADHHMTALGVAPAVADETHFNKDYVGADYHNDGHTHIDALCHVAYDGSLYNGKPETAVTDAGARTDSIAVLKDGLIGRGVLLDVPRARGVSWLEPGEHIFSEDLEAAESEQGVRVGQGDVLLVRTGHARRLDDLGSWDTPHAKAGLHPTALSFLRTGTSPCSDRTATAILRRAPPRAWRFRFTYSRSPRWGSICSITCSSRTSARSASGPGDGSSCSSRRRYGSSTEPALR